MTVSDLDLTAAAPGPGVDGAMTVTGMVQEVDAARRRVRVGMPGGASLWLPAMPSRYLVTAADAGLARVLVDPVTSRPLLVVGSIDPRPPSILAPVTAVSGTVVTVTWAGAAVALPAIPSTYSTGSTAWVLTDDWGAPVLVLGPSSLAAPSTPTPPPPAPGPSTVQVTQPIVPQWSGSWRHSSGRYGDWNASRYGGQSTLYQGSGFGSGPMTGIAVYGDQITNLAAISIDRIAVMTRSVGLSGASGPVTLQGTAQGAQPPGPPAPSGATVAAVAGEWTDLPAAIRTAMAAGTVKGLCAVGANYWAVAGAGNGDGMLLSVTYTRQV